VQSAAARQDENDPLGIRMAYGLAAAAGLDGQLSEAHEALDVVDVRVSRAEERLVASRRGAQVDGLLLNIAH